MAENLWALVLPVLATLWCAVQLGGCSKHVAEPPASTQTSKTPTTAAQGVLQTGVSRTPDELAACRAEEARRAAGESRTPVPPPERPVQLRDKPRSLTLKECDEMVRRWNFYSGKDRDGCFVNAFRVTSNEGVTDLATGLLWQSTTSERPLPFSEVESYLARLNRERFGGFSDWRLPTLEEGFSLIESVPFDNTHTDNRLFVTQVEWWTSDFHTSADYQWVLFTVGGGCLLVPRDHNTRHYVRAVRSSY
jgi:serine/threonine-protein kinase